MLKLSVINRELTVSPDYNPLLSGARYVDQVQFTFDDEWQPYVKTAVFFIDRLDPILVALQHDDDVIDIPAEMLTERGYITIGVFGTATLPDSGHVSRITSSAFRYLIKAGVAEQINFETPTDTLWDQYVQKMNDYVVKGEAAASRASASEKAAKDSEEKALASQQAAKASEDAAAQSAQEADQSQQQAAASEANAKESEEKALVSEQNAKASEDKARQSQLEADRSEKNAKKSEVNAKKSENAAAESAAKARESQEASKASELAAKESEENAKISEELASAAWENVADLHDEVEVLADDVTRQHQHIHQDHVLIHEDLEVYQQLHEDFTHLEADIVNAQVDFNETEAHIEQMRDETQYLKECTDEAMMHAKDSETCAAEHDENAYQYMTEAKKYQERAQIFAGLEMPEFYFDVETMSLNIKYPELKHPEVQRNIRFILIDNVLYWDLPQLNEP